MMGVPFFTTRSLKALISNAKRKQETIPILPQTRELVKMKS